MLASIRRFVNVSGLLAVVVSTATPSAMAAQTALQVVDAGGRPISAVRIDVFGLGELIAVDSTSARGTVELDIDRWPDVRRISLSHLGFRTLVLQADEIPNDGVIRMEPAAIAIEGVAVEGRELCPITAEPRARRLWSEVASRYATDTGSRAWSAYLSRFVGGVNEGELHRAPEGDGVDYVVAGQGGVIHGEDQTPRPIDERIVAEGYAWPPLTIAGTTGGLNLAWAYAPLDRHGAHHFASAAFGALHHFAVDTESDGEATLVFCGNGEGVGATIEGVVTLVPGERFVDAEWRVRTEDPDEGAGGSVSFASLRGAFGEKAHLVPSRGLFYRHSGSEPPYPDLPRSYSRVVTKNAGWYLHPSDDHPCNTGRSYHLNPPNSPDGVRFVACVAEHWGRE